MYRHNDSTIVCERCCCCCWKYSFDKSYCCWCCSSEGRCSSSRAVRSATFVHDINGSAPLLLNSPLSPHYSKPPSKHDEEDHVYLLTRPYLQNWICWAYHQPVPAAEQERVKRALRLASKDLELKSPEDFTVSSILPYQDPGPIDTSPLSLLGHLLLLRPNVIVGERKGGAKEDSSSQQSSSSSAMLDVPVRMERAQSFNGVQPTPLAASPQINGAIHSSIQNISSSSSPSRTDEQMGCCTVSEGFYELLRSVHGVLCDDGQSISFQSFDGNKSTKSASASMHHHVLASAAALKQTLKYCHLSDTTPLVNNPYHRKLELKCIIHLNNNSNNNRINNI